jgi:predicted RNase H-like HicB family nuclease
MDKEHKLRCYGYKKNGKYYAACVDLTLIDDGNTMEEAKISLEENILGYLECIAKNGIAKELFPRRAPFSRFIHYYWVKLLTRFHFPKKLATVFELKIKFGELQVA